MNDYIVESKHCPNCGAPLEKETKCSYCRSELKVKYLPPSDWGGRKLYDYTGISLHDPTRIVLIELN